MTEIIKDFEQGYSTTCAEITQLSGKLKQTTGNEELEELNSKIGTLFIDAQETLEQMELESHSLQGRNKEKVTMRLDSYKAELKRLHQNYNSCKMEAKQRSDRLELFARSEEVENNDIYHDMESEQSLNSSSRHLEDGRRLLTETEQIGGHVLDDLLSQRETLQRARSRLKDVEAGLGSSNSVLTGIIFKARQNKIVLASLIAIILLFLLWGLYRLTF